MCNFLDDSALHLYRHGLLHYYTRKLELLSFSSLLFASPVRKLAASYAVSNLTDSGGVKAFFHHLDPLFFHFNATPAPQNVSILNLYFNAAFLYESTFIRLI